MNSQSETINFQWKVFFIVVLLIVLSTPSVALNPQGQAEIEKRVNALTAQDISALLQRAKSGDVTAQYMLGQAYYLGKGTATDYTEALKWLRKAAEQGYALAQYSLVGVYGGGNGEPANDKEQMKWLLKAAEGGLAIAEYLWGYFTEESQRDHAEAAKWYRKAADQGFAPAQNALGFQYEKGQGVQQEFKEAVKWYLKAAEQGDANAQSNLGTLYNAGRGVGKDFNEAAKWFRLSAEQGWVNGQANLAGVYMLGHGVPTDLVSAYMWLTLAAAAGSTECKEGLKVLESRMKVEEIAEARHRARAWSEEHPERVKAVGQPGDSERPAPPANVVTADTEGRPRANVIQKDSSAEKIRSRAVELATALESDPISNKAKEFRQEMKKLMSNKELGVSLIICMQALGNVFSNEEYRDELLGQFIYSQVKFAIQHPGEADNIHRMTVAGIEGVLSAYAAIKKVKPKVRSIGLEDLLDKRQSGLLGDFVKSRGC